MEETKALETPVVIEEWPTTDMYFAAFLLTKDIAMVRYESKMLGGHPKVTFIFRRSPNLEQLKQDYHAGKAEVSAFKFVGQIKALKSVVHTT